jgi:hypothetical protein
MPRQTRNSRKRLEVSTQTNPSLLRHREVATSPIRMAANENNVRFNLDDENNIEDIVNNGGEHNVNG